MPFSHDTSVMAGTFEVKISVYMLSTLLVTVESFGCKNFH